jgi:cytochrome c-type biogenesis protein CcmH/NrfF
MRTIFQSSTTSPWASAQRWLQVAVLMIAATLFLGAGDDARFQMLGHKLMCVCGCNQILLECNHVGCSYSTRMRDELAVATDRGDNDDLTLQSFVQKYGPTVIAAPTVTGFNIVAWVMPFVVLVAGLILVVYVVRTWRSRPTPALAGGIMLPRSADLDKFREQARSETEL